MHNYKQLKVWEKAIELVITVYEVTSTFPKVEKFGLVSQMRRSAISIPSNIAEGAGRNSEKGFCHFLSNSHGSSFELETQVILASKLELFTNEKCNELCLKINEVQRMSYSLQEKLNPDNIHFTSSAKSKI